MVQVRDLLTGNIWLWERGKFVNRRYIMQVLNTHFYNEFIYIYDDVLHNMILCNFEF